MQTDMTPSPEQNTAGLRESACIAVIPYPQPAAYRNSVTEDLGAEAADTLYDTMVRDMAAMLDRIGASLAVHTPDRESAPALGKLLDREVAPLPDDSLAAAFDEAYANGAKRVAAIIGLLPDYSASLITKSLNELRMRHALLGSTPERELYMVGFAKPFYEPECLRMLDTQLEAMADPNMDLRVIRTYDPVADVLTDKKLELLTLPEWTTVRTMWDLNVIYRQNKQANFNHSETWQLLREHAETLAAYDMDRPTRPGFTLDPSATP